MSKSTRDRISLREVAANICDLFEDVLDEHDISIPDENRQGDEDEARLYGKAHWEVEEKVAEILNSLVRVIKDNPHITVDTIQF